jgi:prolyl-tRNA editing enzyme YbaK/EbsC (Cys-tRNA(Pro) deacylase)
MMDAAHIAAYLRDNDIAGEVVSLTEHTPTVEAAARALGTSVDRIAKSVLFLADAAPVLVVANGLARIDYKRLADYLGLSRRRLKLADAEAVLAITGFPVGAMPPFGHRVRLRTLVDARVLAEPEIYAGGGALDALLRIAPAEIARATGAETVDVVQPAQDQEMTP